jgi:hypothetical protein
VYKVFGKKSFERNKSVGIHVICRPGDCYSGLCGSCPRLVAPRPDWHSTPSLSMVQNCGAKPPTWQVCRVSLCAVHTEAQQLWYHGIGWPWHAARRGHRRAHLSTTLCGFVLRRGGALLSFRAAYASHTCQCVCFFYYNLYKHN